MLIKVTAKSKFLLGRQKMPAQLVKIPFIVCLECLIFTGQTSHMVYKYQEFPASGF